jgi:signal transduction histidine kinase
MLKHLDHKVITISSVALAIVALLTVNSISILIDAKKDASQQIHDMEQGALNADFDVALVRAAGEAASFTITKNQTYLAEAQRALLLARTALDRLRKTLGDNPPTEGLEGKHLAFITRQRGVLAMVERGLSAAQNLGTITEQTRLDQVLDDIYAYEPKTEILRAEVSEHRELEATTNARDMQDDHQKLIYAFVGNFVVLIALIGIALFFTRRFVVKPINRLALVASAVAQGDFGQQTAVTGKDEIGHLQSAFSQMVNELRDSREQLRSFTADLDTNIEAERGRIAHALHDELGQNLTALGLHLNNVQKQSTDHLRVLEIAQRMKGLITDTGAAMRRIIADLRPLALDNFGLAVAADALAKDFAADTGLKVHVRAEGEFDDLPDTHKTALYRMLQESLTNIAKHARASQVDVELANRDDGVVIRVRDNGVGFSGQSPKRSGSYGLFGMTERAAQRGGKVSIETAPGAGTTITCWLPSSGSLSAAGPGSAEITDAR